MRSKERADADRFVAANIGLTLLPPSVALIWSTATLPTTPGVDEPKYVFLALSALAVGTFATSLSSLVDRWIITPWRDGTLGSLPYRSNTMHVRVKGDRSDRQVMTKLWLWHRLAALGIQWLAVLGLFASSMLLALRLLGFDELEPTMSMGSLTASALGASVVMRPWTREIGDAVGVSISNLEKFVGDYIKFTLGNNVEVGVIYEVSLDHGATVVTPEHPDGVRISLSDLQQGSSVQVLPAPDSWEAIDSAVKKSRLGDIGDFWREKRVVSRRFLLF